MVRSARKGASRTTRAFAPLHPLEEVGGEVALGEGRQDDDDQLAGHLRTGADLEGGGQRGAGGDADRQSLHRRRGARNAEGGVVSDAPDRVQLSGIEVSGHEARAEAPNGRASWREKVGAAE